MSIFSPIGGHAAAALKHHWIDRDGILNRMLPQGKKHD
jgi:cytochrome b561